MLKEILCSDLKSLDDQYTISSSSLNKLKDSTKKLLCLVEEIQSKTHSQALVPDEAPKVRQLIEPIPETLDHISISNIIGASALKKLETQAYHLSDIYIEEEYDDCSVYKRLTRKCHCLNKKEYNDFIIHFNEDTKYCTNNSGEIIKNVRILKKFLYMGGEYSKNALVFFNKGLTESSHKEITDIVQGCSYADVCNVFEEDSFVKVFILWPCKYEYFEDNTIQSLAAAFLLKIAQVEEGRRYINFSSKIVNELKKVLRKRRSQLDYEVLDMINSTLNLLNPPPIQQTHKTYYVNSIEEGFGYKTLISLVKFHYNMTIDEIFTHMDLINKHSIIDNGKLELRNHLPLLLNVFKHLLMKYDNSEMNIIITNILNNIVCKKMLQKTYATQPLSCLPKSSAGTDVATDPIKMKNVMNQVSTKKTKILSYKKHQSSQRKSNELIWEPTIQRINRSQKFTKGLKSNVIVVPIEKEVIF